MASIIKPLFQRVKFLRFEFDARISACRTATLLGSGASHVKRLCPPPAYSCRLRFSPAAPAELERVGTGNKRLVSTEIGHDNVKELSAPSFFTMLTFDLHLTQRNTATWQVCVTDS